MGEFWELFAKTILAGLNVDEPRPVLPPSPVELLPMVRSHRRVRVRVGERRVPPSLVPPEVAVARETERRAVPLRSLAWLQGVKR